MARGCHGRLKKLKIKNWKETAKDRRTWRDLAEKAKTHNPLSRCGFDTALKMYSNDGCIVGFVVMFQRNVLYQSSL
jgi:hypothetical protein